MGEVADALYFVKQGELVCHTGGGGEDKDKIRLKQGAVFGESCLEPTAKDAVRKANVVAVGDCTILKLTRTTFLEQLGDLADIVAENFKHKVLEGMMIDGTPIFTKLPSEDQTKFMDSLTEKNFEEGTVIITQGNDNNTFYIIKSGTVTVAQSDMEIAQLNAGQFFGERALLKDEPANASIQAKGLVTCYVCTREAFTAVVGPLQALIDAEVTRRDRAAETAKVPPAAPYARRPPSQDSSARRTPLRPHLPSAQVPQPKWADLELRRILGVGTFGRVKLVLHKQTNTSYALKCMRKQQVVATKQQSHVLNEKRILAAMDHPFILRLVATYQDEGELYMLLELGLGGRTMLKLPPWQSPPPAPQTKQMARGSRRVAEEAHWLRFIR